MSHRLLPATNAAGPYKHRHLFKKLSWGEEQTAADVLEVKCECICSLFVIIISRKCCFFGSWHLYIGFVLLGKTHQFCWWYVTKNDCVTKTMTSVCSFSTAGS